MVLYSDTWHKGVVGIVASRMVDRYYRPTIILTGSEEMVSGSARSVVGFDIHHAISECSDLLEQYGGHQMAAGVSLKKENVKPFQDRFEEVVSGMITEEHLTPVLDIDEEISLTRITDKFVSVIKQFAPFGPGNLNPVFRSNRLIAMDVRKVGAEDKHIKLSVADPFHHNRQVEAIAFNLGQHYDAISDGGQFDMAYTIEENHWNGRVTIQLKVKDIKMIA
jgi:single-stranded-DNA-specific exonuclease